MFSYFFWDKDQHIIIRLIQLPINFALVVTVPHYYFVTNSYTTQWKEKVLKKVSYFFGIFLPMKMLFKFNF